MLALLVPAAAGCGTLATPAGDDDAVRPNAGAGPFRDLLDDEVKGTNAPNVLARNSSRRPFRDPTALDREGTGALGSVALYVVTDDRSGAPAVFRFLAPDGRSFPPQAPDPPEPVLVADQPWEGSAIAGPAVLRLDGEVLLFYSAAGGIGLARSADGVSFSKGSGPVLTADGAAPWEGGEAPSHPTAWLRDDGRIGLLFTAAGGIGEARGTLEEGFARVGAEPVLAPGPGGEHDGVRVGEPVFVRASSAEGRAIDRIYYSALDERGLSSVGLAARFGEEGPFSRAVGPAFPPKRDPRDPTVLVFSGFTLLYVEQHAGQSTSARYPAIAAAVAPATVRLPPP